MARTGTARVELEGSPPAAIFAVVSVSLLAWVVLLYGAHTEASGFIAAFAMWNVMMVAMMLPSLTPWIGLFPKAGAPIFAAGYFTVWALYCSLAAVVQLEASSALHLPHAAGGLLLMAAGLYELTPLKAACLRRCRSPIGELLRRWRSGRWFYFRIGLSHGINCLGCCWALMAIAFALGVMNLWWMAALTLVVAIEKLAPRGEALSRALGVALVAWGAVVVVAAAHS